MDFSSSNWPTELEHWLSRDQPLGGSSNSLLLAGRDDFSVRSPSRGVLSYHGEASVPAFVADKQDMMLTDGKSKGLLLSKLQLQLRDLKTELEKTPGTLNARISPKVQAKTPDRELQGLRSLGGGVRIASECVAFSPSSVSTGVTDRLTDALAARLEQAEKQLRDFQKATDTQIAACRMGLSEVTGLLEQSEKRANHVEHEVVILEEGAASAAATSEVRMASCHLELARAERRNNLLETELEFKLLQSARRENNECSEAEYALATMNSELQYVEASRDSAEARLSAMSDGILYAEERAVQIEESAAALEACKVLARVGTVSRKADPAREIDPLRATQMPDITTTVANIQALCNGRPKLELMGSTSQPTCAYDSIESPTRTITTVPRRRRAATSATHGAGTEEPATYYVWVPPDFSEASQQALRADVSKSPVKERVLTSALDADKPRRVVSTSSSLSQIARCCHKATAHSPIRPITSALYSKLCFKGKSRSNESLHPPLKESPRHDCGKHCNSGSQISTPRRRPLRVDRDCVKSYPERPRTASPACRSSTAATGAKGTVGRELQKEHIRRHAAHDFLRAASNDHLDVFLQSCVARAASPQAREQQPQMRQGFSAEAEKLQQSQQQPREFQPQQSQEELTCRSSSPIVVRRNVPI